MRSREQILLEIKRTARTNDGKPLGMQRFASETGIQKAEWAGRYWARWSDAIAEAGLTPNQYNQAHDSEWLLECVATEARRLGHIPTDNELKMARRDNPEFPSAGSVHRRGPKHSLIRDLAEFCERSGDFEDVLAIVLPQLSGETRDSDSGEAQANREGFVYLLKSRASLQNRAHGFTR
ncbi:MAG: hypothetical protein WAO61_02885 [Solirubrobacterales bacterium]